MVFIGQLWKDEKFWVVTVPSLEVTTQGRTRREALRMIADAIEEHVAKPGFHVMVRMIRGMHQKAGAAEQFFVTAKHHAELAALFLRRQRQLNNLSVREVAKRLGYASASAYAQYETGRHLPGLDKLSKFLAAMNPKVTWALEIVPA